MTTPTTASRSRTRTPEGTDEESGDDGTGQEAEHGRDAQEDCAGRAGEAELGEGVDREGHVAGHHEAAHHARHDRDHDAGLDGVLDEVVPQKVHELGDHRAVPPDCSQLSSTAGR